MGHSYIPSGRHLSTFSSGFGSSTTPPRAPAWNWLMAASLVVMLPVLVVFVVFSNCCQGITVTGGVK